MKRITIRQEKDHICKKKKSNHSRYFKVGPLITYSDTVFSGKLLGTCVIPVHLTRTRVRSKG